MSRAATSLGAGLLAAFAAGALIWAGAEAEPGAMPEEIDLSAGEALYAENCAACHGTDLEGQENWRSPDQTGRLPAPPHDETGHTWHHSDQVLFDYTRLGGRAAMAEQGMEFDSGMPGFGDRLTDQEIWNILGYIKSTWPERIREVQAIRSAGESRKRGN